jgi:hypothetical protein
LITLLILDDRNVYDFPDKTEGFGDHVIQITWLTTCPNLKTLCTRNFTATTTADDNFLHQLPNNYKQLTWTLTGTIHLPQSHYSALVAPQHPFDDPVINPDTPFPPENYELVHPLPDVLLRKSIELASVVGSRWKDKIIKDARTEKLILNFKIKIMFSQEWSFPESAFGEGKVRKWLERGLPQYVIDMVNKLNEEYPE